MCTLLYKLESFTGISTKLWEKLYRHTLKIILLRFEIANQLLTCQWLYFVQWMNGNTYHLFAKWIKLVTKDVYVKSKKVHGFLEIWNLSSCLSFCLCFSLCLSWYLLYYCYFQWRNIFSSIKVGALVFFHCTHLAKMRTVTCETMSIVLWLCGLWDWRTGQIMLFVQLSEILLAYYKQIIFNLYNPHVQAWKMQAWTEPEPWPLWFLCSTLPVEPSG